MFTERITGQLRERKFNKIQWGGGWEDFWSLHKGAGEEEKIEEQ